MSEQRPTLAHAVCARRHDAKVQDMSVFISYSRKDQAFVDQLALALTKRHVTVWKDSWKMLVGDSLSNQINTGILLLPRRVT
jgi:hypothetical protein